MSLQRGMPLMSDVVKRTKSKSTASPSTQSEFSFDIVDICNVAMLSSTLQNILSFRMRKCIDYGRYRQSNTRKRADKVKR